MAALSLSYSLIPKPSHNQTQTAISLSRPNLSFLSHSLSHLSLTARKHPVVPKATDTEAALSVTDAEIETPVLEIEPAVETSEPKREEVFAVVMVIANLINLNWLTSSFVTCILVLADFLIRDLHIGIGSLICNWTCELIVQSKLVIAKTFQVGLRCFTIFSRSLVGGRQYIVFPGRYIYTQRLKGASVNDKVTLNKVLLVGTKTSAYIGKPIVPNATVEAVVEEQTLDKKVIVFKYKKKKNYRRNIGHRQPITRIRITSITGYQDSPVTTLN
ncbi:hypothetical protein SASPL_123003 [Salvia splendens]|uniref:Large subunit ribosomal protein L21 n=1 Tax=Salvia splendens TaxID=180675 RepID=A0A8X8XJJ1_SALSN|nr:hypothetical protein SASPL_123003 [Salvia splendens]